MALFKIFKGNSSALGAAPSANTHDTREAHEGFAYFTTDDGKFYIDIADANTAVIGTNRIPLSADKADKDASGNVITSTYLTNVAWNNSNKKLSKTVGGTSSDILQFIAGSGISLTAAASSLTIDNSGVRSISTGTTNGTISVNTNGTNAEVAIAGLGSNAYTSTAYLPLSGGTMTGQITLPSQAAACNEKNIKFSSGGYIGGDTSGNIGIFATAIYLRAGNKDASSGQGLIMTTGQQMNPYEDNVFTLGTSSLRFKNIYAATFNGALSGIAEKATADSSGNNIINTYLTKAAGVTSVAWDNTNKKLTKTINGSTSDIVAVTVNNPTLAWNTESIIAKIGTVDIKVKLPENPNTDTLVNQTEKTDSVEYKLLTTVSALPTPGSAAEAGYGANLAYNPSLNRLSTGNVKLTGELDVTGNAYLRNQTTVDNLTAGSLIVNGNSSFVNDVSFTKIPTAPTAAAGTNNTQLATTEFVTGAVTGLAGPMRFIGTLGTGGTITALPTAAESNKGWTYKVITKGTYGSTYAEVGDLFISNGSSWINIPSGDVPDGTVTNVATGDGLTGGPITSTGTISHAIPSDASAGSRGSSTARYYIKTITTDKFGHVTGVTTGNETVTNTDTLVQQTAKTDNKNYKLLFTSSDSPTSGNAATAAYDTGITVNPSTDTITATNFAGNATTATKIKYQDISNTSPATDLNDLKDDDYAVYYAGGGNTVVNGPDGASLGFGLTVKRIAAGYRMQDLITVVGSRYTRKWNNGSSSWEDWVRLPDGVGNGASGTWGINITGSAGSVAWNNITNKPSTTLATDTGTSTITLAHGGKYKLTAGGSSVIFTMPTDNNTDTKVNVVARGTTKAYLLATTTSPTSTAQAVTSVAETGVYLDTTAGKLVTTALDVSGTVNLNGETTANSLTAGNLEVTGSATFVNTINGNIATADKVNNALKIQGNGTDSFTYDGSTAKTLNIKAGSNVSISSDNSGNITIASSYTNSRDEGYGRITPAGDTGTSAVTANTTQITAKSYNEGFTFKTGNKWLTIAGTESATTNSDILTIGHKAGLTAKSSYGSTATTASADGGTIKVTDVQYDEAGHITASTDRTITLSQVKNTAGSTDTTSKIFLIGATSQAANPQTYSDSEVYVTNGTLYLVKTQNLSGTANNKPALIVGGADTSTHMELDCNEIQAKTNGTSVAQLYLNNDGGLVTVGSGGLAVTSLTASQAVSTDANKKLVSTNLSVTDSTADDGIQYVYKVTQSAVGKITVFKSNIRSASTSQTGVVQLNDGIASTSTTLAATANSAYTASRAVRQSASTTANWRKILLHYKDDAASTTAVTDSTNQVYAAVGVSVQPSTGAIRATKYNVADGVELQYDSTLEVLNFVFS